MLATCKGGNLRDVRDRAIPLVAFASGGRRRSEIAGLRRDQISVEPPIAVEGGLPYPLSPSIWVAQTSGAEQNEIVYLTGRSGDDLNAWLVAAGIETGRIFRKIDRCGNISKRALEPNAVNQITAASPARSYGAVPTQIDPADLQLSQPRNQANWTGRAASIVAAADLVKTQVACGAAEGLRKRGVPFKRISRAPGASKF